MASLPLTGAANCSFAEPAPARVNEALADPTNAMSGVACVRSQLLRLNRCSKEFSGTTSRRALATAGQRSPRGIWSKPMSAIYVYAREFERCVDLLTRKLEETAARAGVPDSECTDLEATLVALPPMRRLTGASVTLKGSWRQTAGVI